MPKRPIFARRHARAVPTEARGRLELVEAKRLAGFAPVPSRRTIQRFEDTRYFVHATPLIGDAPKNFVSVHVPGYSKRDDPETWPQFIAKVGHKRYPTESITEHLLTRIGECFGLEMARSRLMSFRGQIRFLSEYFLQGEEILLHGAQIVSSYLEDPDFEDFSAAVRKARLEPEIFTFLTLSRAILTRFTVDGAALVDGLVRAIAYDALVGNHDRHLYNWGVIVEARGQEPPRFAPLFDTARALFWNESEDELARRDENSIRAYVEKSKPVIGVERAKGINHFELMYAVAAEGARYVRVLQDLKNDVALEETMEMIDREFGEMLSECRRDRIKRCLAVRYDRYCKVLSEC